MSVPALKGEMLLDEFQQEVGEDGKSRRENLVTGLSKGALGDLRAKAIGVEQSLEEGIQAKRSGKRLHEIEGRNQ